MKHSCCSLWCGLVHPARSFPSRLLFLLCSLGVKIIGRVGIYQTAPDTNRVIHRHPAHAGHSGQLVLLGIQWVLFFQEQQHVPCSFGQHVALDRTSTILFGIGWGKEGARHLIHERGRHCDAIEALLSKEIKIMDWPSW